jgi:hypothetical protein
MVATSFLTTTHRIENLRKPKIQISRINKTYLTYKVNLIANNSLHRKFNNDNPIINESPLQITLKTMHHVRIKSIPLLPKTFMVHGQICNYISIITK